MEVSYHSYVDSCDAAGSQYGSNYSMVSFKPVSAVLSHRKRSMLDVSNEYKKEAARR